MKSSIRSFAGLKGKFTPEIDFLKLKLGWWLLAGSEQPDRVLYEDVSSSTAPTIAIFIVLTIKSTGE